MDSLPPNDQKERGLTPLSDGVPDNPLNPLNPVIRRLIESKAARLFGDRPIGDFWCPSDPRSPFEEALTIRQLCGLNLDPFIQKRSFTEKKLQALMKAIEGCIASGETSRSSVDEENAHRVSADRPLAGAASHGRNSAIASHQSIWGRVEGVHPFVASTLSSLLASADSDGPILSRIAHRASIAIPVEGLEVLACCQYLTETETAKLLGRERHHVKNITDNAILLAREMLQNDPILSLPLLLLRGSVLVSPDLIVSQLRASSPIEPGAARFAVSILCYAAALLPVTTEGLGRWLMTAENARVEESLEAIKSRLPRDNQEILSWVEGMFPLVSREHCEAILGVVGTYDETTELWFSSSEQPLARTRVHQASSSSKRRSKKGAANRDLN